MPEKKGSTVTPDQKRRRFLVGATALVGGVGVAGMASPFLMSWNPNAKARALGAPISVNLAALEVGALLVVEWRGKPVFIIRHSNESKKLLQQTDSRLADPDSAISIQPDFAKNWHRSVSDEFTVLVGICTHLGCSPKFYPVVQPESFDSEWKGGFYCPCHGSKFDLAGRVYARVPAPTNMEVPPYAMNNNVITIGAEV